MSQTEHPESTTGENPRVSKSEKPTLCHIHDKAGVWDDKDEIRQNVCVKDEDFPPHTDGNHYCLFHLPSKDKDKDNKFENKFRERLAEVEKAITDTKKLDETERETAKNKITYDFRYVFFPSYLDLQKYNFKSYADFSAATFTSAADFSAATFTSAADFSAATFTSYANFSAATFTSDANFSEATFTSAADFRAAKFEEKSQVYFLETKFCSKIIFNQTEIEGYVEFERNVFLNAEAVKVLEQELEVKFAGLTKELAGRGIEVEFPSIEFAEDQEAILNFQNVRLRNPERVSFNSTTLRPNWFVNVDEARKIAFNDVEWLNTEIDINRDGLKKELESLNKRFISRRERSLIKACNQLADNAEANRRFEEMRLFRKQSIALLKYQCHIHDETDSRKKDDIRQSVCQEFPVVNEDGGNYYCLWHNPDKNKSEVFLREFEKRKKAGHTDFRTVVFPVAVEYTDTLPDAMDFRGATFMRRVLFEKAEIKKLDFTSAYFTEISELVFKDSTCEEKIILDKADIDGKIFFNGTDKRNLFINPVKALSLKDARIEKSHWINFRCIRLLPHYFIDVDSSKFVFLDCKWRDPNDEDFKIETEIKSGTHKEIAQTCNQLAVNYEENRLYDESSDFRYAAMEAKRLGYKSTFTKIFNLYWLYKWTSGYGERRLWATGILAALILFFGFVYATNFAVFEHQESQPNPNEFFIGRLCRENRIIGNANGIGVCDGLVHSLAVASFQRPEPKPANSLTKFLVTLETILAPLQAALLALAIRRKFMR